VSKREEKGEGKDEEQGEIENAISRKVDEVNIRGTDRRESMEDVAESHLIDTLNAGNLPSCLGRRAMERWSCARVGEE